MRVLIIEDEPFVAKDITQRVQQLLPEAEVLEILTSVEASKRWLSSHLLPDLILSDIHLSDGISFEIFEHTDIDCPIIFTTAYDEYAIRAFRLNSIDYLLKPIDINELSRALKKYKSLNGKISLNKEIKNMISRWDKGNAGYKERFLVVHGNSMVPLKTEEIAYFHKEQLIFVYNMYNEKFICDFNALDDVEELIDPKFFFRVNRQYILHVQAVGRVKPTHKGLTVILKTTGHPEIDISREKATAFKKWLG